MFVAEYDFHARQGQAGEQKAARHYANFLFSEQKWGEFLDYEAKKTAPNGYRFTFAIGRHLRSGENLNRKYSRDRAALYLA